MTASSGSAATQPIGVDLWRMAWPATLGIIVHQLFRLNDQYFVAPLGLDAQAAVAVGSMVAIFLVAFGEMVGIGTLAIASRRFGAGDNDAGNGVLRAGLFLGVGVGLALGIAVFLCRDALCSWMIPDGAQGRVHEEERRMCGEYLLWIGGGQAVMIAAQVSDQAFLALKQARTSLLLQLLSVVANAVLNAVLVPHFGVHGIGFATIASRFLAAGAGIALLRVRGNLPPLLAPPPRPTPPGIRRRILRIGLPACIAIGVYSLVYQVMLATTIREFGPAARSALGIGFGIETIFYSLYWGTGAALASLVGRYLGEGDPDRALAVSRLALRSNLLVGCAVGGVFLLAGPALVAPFSDVQIVVETNAEYLRYMAFAQPFQALQVGFDNALIGAGNTLPIMISSVTMNCLRIPLAHLFSLTWGCGLAGVWWALNLSSIGKSLWAGALFWRRRWLHTEV